VVRYVGAAEAAVAKLELGDLVSGGSVHDRDRRAKAGGEGGAAALVEN